MKFLKGALATFVTALTINVALVAGAGAAMNQAPVAPPPAYAGAKNPQTVNDATLKRVAAAYVQVRHITLQTRQTLNNTNDTHKQRQIIRDAELKKITAVKRMGVQPREYNEVILLVQNNNQLQRKFLSYVHQAEGASGGAM